MASDPTALLQAIFDDTTSAHRRFAGQGFTAVAAAADGIGRAVTTGKKVLAFGNGGNAGPKDVLFFTAGPSHEEHGLFGKLVAVPPPGRQR